MITDYFDYCRVRSDQSQAHLCVGDDLVNRLTCQDFVSMVLVEVVVICVCYLPVVAFFFFAIYFDFAVLLALLYLCVCAVLPVAMRVLWC